MTRSFWARYLVPRNFEDIAALLHVDDEDELAVQEAGPWVVAASGEVINQRNRRLPLCHFIGQRMFPGHTAVVPESVLLGNRQNFCRSNVFVRGYSLYRQTVHPIGEPRHNPAHSVVAIEMPTGERVSVNEDYLGELRKHFWVLNAGGEPIDQQTHELMLHVVARLKAAEAGAGAAGVGSSSCSSDQTGIGNWVTPPASRVRYLASPLCLERRAVFISGISSNGDQVYQRSSLTAYMGVQRSPGSRFSVTVFLDTKHAQAVAEQHLWVLDDKGNVVSAADAPEDTTEPQRLDACIMRLAHPEFVGDLGHIWHAQGATKAARKLDCCVDSMYAANLPQRLMRLDDQIQLEPAVSSAPGKRPVPKYAVHACVDLYDVVVARTKTLAKANIIRQAVRSYLRQPSRDCPRTSPWLAGVPEQAGVRVALQRHMNWIKEHTRMVRQSWSDAMQADASVVGGSTEFKQPV